MLCCFSARTQGFNSQIRLFIWAHKQVQSFLLKMIFAKYLSTNIFGKICRILVRVICALRYVLSLSRLSVVNGFVVLMGLSRLTRNPWAMENFGNRALFFSPHHRLSASLVHLFYLLFLNLQRLASLSPLSLLLTKLKQTRRIRGGEEADRRRCAMRDAAPARRPPHPYFPTPRLSSPPPAPLQHSSPTPCAPSSVRSEVGLYWSFVCFVFIVNELGVIWLACLVC